MSHNSLQGGVGWTPWSAAGPLASLLLVTLHKGWPGGQPRTRGSTLPLLVRKFASARLLQPPPATQIDRNTNQTVGPPPMAASRLSSRLSDRFRAPHHRSAQISQL